ncbi:DUF192 domain-containing protein [Patescibacteria group bacterium]|nr:DUF192 domain-containing protein [Candidatus Falkowbacteria bacterium]MBU3905839.1 DUF192 domain-containing protein [Patescibacteria group bacterium]MBU4015182.1 DUF192 domain-containing protein [Patescibacteria group bacterium]MBU4027214.1 DUF192 domain-containing protein [Patescibacteria group bacterium]MBU4073393.1 DUF192 domain-containing protein [Patescibacteria group bacterium]
MKKILFLACGAILILSACSSNNIKSATINNTEIKIEIADTPELRYQGLSNKEKLCADCGMLFVFPNKEIRTFVMRDMNFPLDIIWIDDEKVVKINKNTLPEGSDPVMRYSSDAPANYVLEVNSGFCEENGIGVGDKINLK